MAAADTDHRVNATAYTWVRRHLRNDASFRALRARWERYLVTIGQPFIGSSGLKKCTANPHCFHNHEAVGAFGDLQLMQTGLRSHMRGAKLSDPRALRASAQAARRSRAQCSGTSPVWR